jgi:transketolase
MTVPAPNKLATVRLSLEQLNAICAETRLSIFRIGAAESSSHIGGCSGAVELMVGLYFGGILRLNPSDDKDERRDRVLVRGHLGPLRYTLLSFLGFIDHEELKSYRHYGARLHGHEDHIETPGVDISPAGSLGMVLSYGIGAAIVARNSRSGSNTFVFVGDGEEQEGNIAEAARHAAHLELDNLTVVIDCNGKQLATPTQKADSTDIDMVWAGYGWTVIQLSDGNDVAAVCDAYREALSHTGKKRPVVIIAHTQKGMGLEGAQDHFSGYHTAGTCGNTTILKAIAQLLSETPTYADALQTAISAIQRTWAYSSPSLSIPSTRHFEKVTIRLKPLATTKNNPDTCQMDYFPRASAHLAHAGISRDTLYFLTADIIRDDYVALLRLPEYWQFYNVGIREQHMIAMAHGISLCEPASRILINGLDAFAYRFMDQLNAAAQGQSSMIILGDVAGLTNARNGKTHQTSGQPAALALMPGVTLLEPWDAEDTFNCLNWALGESRGIVYVRLHGGTVSETTNYQRNISQYIVRDCSQPACVVIACGLMVEVALIAARELSARGTEIRVVNVIQHRFDGSLIPYIESSCPLLTAYNGSKNLLLAEVALSLSTMGSSRPRRIRGLGFDTGTTGDLASLLSHCGLDVHGVIQSILQLINE